MTAAPHRPLPGLAGTHDRRRTIAFCFAALSIGAMLASSSALTPFYPSLEHSLDITSLGVSLVFAIYAVSLLAALLVAGSLSDHVGRRSIISIGLVTLAIGALTVSAVDTAPALFAARALQGTATGVLTPAFSALLLDAASPLRPGRGSLVNAIMPGIGLALGTLMGGVALTLIASALSVTFRVLAGLYLALGVVVWLLPETSPRRTGAIRSLVPQVSIPRPVRRLFLISAPALIASWATGGLFLSLGPSIIAESLHSDSSFVQGAVVALLPAAGAVAVVALCRLSPRVISIIGTSSLAVGTALALLALSTGSLLGYILAVIITGAGFGVSFYGVVGTLAPTSPVEKRAGLFAAIYVTSYLSFGVPTVAAGFLASATSIPLTVAVYGILITALAAVAAIARVRVSD